MMNLKKSSNDSSENKHAKHDKKAMVLSWVTVVTLVFVLIGATYAYLIAGSSSSAGADIETLTGTTDALTFAAGEEINIEADFENFGPGKGSLHDETTASAMLRANNTTNEYRASYNIFFVINRNTFIYSTGDEVKNQKYY